MQRKEKTWVRVAGNATKVKQGLPDGWRCFFRDDTRGDHLGEEFPLTHWKIAGMATENNFIPGFYAKGDENKLVAWIDLYGNAEIKDGVLFVELFEP